MSPPSVLPRRSNNDLSRVECKLPTACTISLKIMVSLKFKTWPGLLRMSSAILSVSCLILNSYSLGTQVGQLLPLQNLLSKLNFNDVFIYP